MKIPEIQMELMVIGNELIKTSKRIQYLSMAASRRKSTRKRAPQTSKRADEELNAAIRVFVGVNPTLPYHQVASLFSVNPGRVSEAMEGKRE